MKPEIATILIRALEGGGYCAITSRAEARHEWSATIAARMAAAKHFAVAEHEIELDVLSPRTMLGSVRQPKQAPAIWWGPLFVGTVLALTVVGAWLWFTKGGAL